MIDNNNNDYTNQTENDIKKQESISNNIVENEINDKILLFKKIYTITKKFITPAVFDITFFYFFYNIMTVFRNISERLFVFVLTFNFIYLLFIFILSIMNITINKLNGIQQQEFYVFSKTTDKKIEVGITICLIILFSFFMALNC